MLRLFRWLRTGCGSRVGKADSAGSRVFPILLGIVAVVVVVDASVIAQDVISSGNFISSAAAKGKRKKGGGAPTGGDAFTEFVSGKQQTTAPASRSDPHQEPKAPQGKSDDASPARGKDDPDDAKSDPANTRSSDAGRGNYQSDRSPSGYDRPPQTLVEAAQRLMKNAQDAVAGTAPRAETSPAAKSEPQSGLGAPPRAVAKSAAPARILNHQPTFFGGKPHSDTEILGLNLTPAAIARLRSLDFTIASTSKLRTISSTVTKLIVPPGKTAVEARELLRSELQIDHLELNKIYRIYRSATDGEARAAQGTQPAGRVGSAVPCRGDRCYGRRLIGWHEGLDGCTAKVRVGVVDTRIDKDHPALAGRKLSIHRFIPSGRKEAPAWHGTGVLALLAGHPNSGTPGLIPGADFYAASVFFDDEGGGFATDTDSLLRALEKMSEQDVNIINMSFAGPKDDLLQKAIAGMSAKGVVFIAAAGNNGPYADKSYPAGYEEVIAVTAVNGERRSFPQASRGDHIDLAAPGVNIWTAVPGSLEGYYSGTSFATPFATAVMAAIFRSDPYHQKDRLLARLEVTDLGAEGRDKIYGRGLVVAPSQCQPGLLTASATPSSPSTGTPTLTVVPARWQARVTRPSAASSAIR